MLVLQPLKAKAAKALVDDAEFCMCDCSDGFHNTKVLYTWTNSRGIRRRRECKLCKERFYTMETIPAEREMGAPFVRRGDQINIAEEWWGVLGTQILMSDERSQVVHIWREAPSGTMVEVASVEKKFVVRSGNGS